MFYPQKKAREIRFKLALRTVLPTFLLTITLFVLFFTTDDLWLFVALMMGATLFIAYYNLYVIYSGFDENILDHETQTFNPKALIAVLDQASSKNTRYALAVIYIANIESITANYGHDRTQHILRIFTDLLLEKLEFMGSKNVPIGYFGMGHFVLGLAHEKAVVLNKLEKLLHSKEIFVVDNVELDLKAAVVVAKARTCTQTLRTLFDLVHKKYREKIIIDEEAERKLFNLEQRIQQAIEAKQLSLYYQKAQHIQGDNPMYELSVKLIDDQNKIIHYKDILPVINRLGLEKAFYIWVVEEALLLMQIHTSLTPMALTIPAVTIRRKDIFHAVEALAKKYYLKPGKLIFIVTEERVYNHIAYYQEILQHYQALGIRIAFHDVDVNTANMEYLKHMNVDMVRYTRSFIEGLTSPFGRTLYENLDKAMKERNIIRWAVKVETASQQAQLEALGIQYLQGWSVSELQPIEKTKKEPL